MHRPITTTTHCLRFDCNKNIRNEIRVGIFSKMLWKFGEDSARVDSVFFAKCVRCTKLFRSIWHVSCSFVFVVSISCIESSSKFHTFFIFSVQELFLFRLAAACFRCSTKKNVLRYVGSTVMFSLCVYEQYACCYSTVGSCFGFGMTSVLHRYGGVTRKNGWNGERNKFCFILILHWTHKSTPSVAPSHPRSTHTHTQIAKRTRSFVLGNLWNWLTSKQEVLLLNSLVSLSHHFRGVRTNTYGNTRRKISETCFKCNSCHLMVYQSQLESAKSVLFCAMSNLAIGIQLKKIKQILAPIKSNARQCPMPEIWKNQNAINWVCLITQWMNVKK